MIKLRNLLKIELQIQFGKLTEIYFLIHLYIYLYIYHVQLFYLIVVKHYVKSNEIKYIIHIKIFKHENLVLKSFKHTVKIKKKNIFYIC